MFREILKNWDMGTIDAIEPTCECGGKTWFIKTEADQHFVLKVSDMVHAEREYKFLTGLTKTELPIAAHVLTSAGNWYAENGKGEIHCLYPKLPGNVVEEHYSGNAQQRAENFGKAIGLLHVCLSRLVNADVDGEMNLVSQIQAWAMPAIEKQKRNVDFVSIGRMWEDTKGNLTLLEKELPLQTIHRDAHPSNMLFAGGKLSGFLDFEMVTRGMRIFDVCYCGSAILVGGFEEAEKAKQWPGFFQALLEGYQKYCALTPLERECVYEILIAIELIFMAFWLENEQVEEARQVEKLLSWLEKHRDDVKV